jgi:hypothetical protein
MQCNKILYNDCAMLPSYVELGMLSSTGPTARLLVYMCSNQGSLQVRHTWYIVTDSQVSTKKSMWYVPKSIKPKLIPLHCTKTHDRPHR